MTWYYWAVVVSGASAPVPLSPLPARYCCPREALDRGILGSRHAPGATPWHAAARGNLAPRTSCAPHIHLTTWRPVSDDRCRRLRRRRHPGRALVTV